MLGAAARRCAPLPCPENMYTDICIHTLKQHQGVHDVFPAGILPLLPVPGRRDYDGLAGDACCVARLEWR